NGEPVRKKTIALLEDYVRDHAQDAAAQSLLAKLYALDHQGGRAKNRIDSALAMAPSDINVLEDAVEMYAALGDRAKAIEYVHKSIAGGAKIAEFRARTRLREI